MYNDDLSYSNHRGPFLYPSPLPHLQSCVSFESIFFRTRGRNEINKSPWIPRVRKPLYNCADGTICRVTNVYISFYTFIYEIVFILYNSIVLFSFFVFRFLNLTRCRVYLSRWRERDVVTNSRCVANGKEIPTAEVQKKSQACNII